MPKWFIGCQRGNTENILMSIESIWIQIPSAAPCVTMSCIYEPMNSQKAAHFIFG